MGRSQGIVELPEVEVLRKKAEAHLLNKKITGFWVKASEREVEGYSVVDCSDEELSKLVGRTIRSVQRRAKFIWFELDETPYPFFTFTLDGDFHFYSLETDRPYSACVEFQIDDGSRFAFGSIRRLCTRIRVGTMDDPKMRDVKAVIRDALSDMPDDSTFVQILSKKTASLKCTLLDNSIVGGIGNWMADEICFQLRVHPLIMASALTTEQASQLREVMQNVVRMAVEVEGKVERLPEDWLVHVRDQKLQPVMYRGQHEVLRETLSGRRTLWVPDLQPRPAPQMMRATNAVSKRARTLKGKEGGKAPAGGSSSAPPLRAMPAAGSQLPAAARETPMQAPVMVANGSGGYSVIMPGGPMGMPFGPPMFGTHGEFLGPGSLPPGMARPPGPPLPPGFVPGQFLPPRPGMPFPPQHMPNLSGLGGFPPPGFLPAPPGMQPPGALVLGYHPQGSVSGLGPPSPSAGFPPALPVHLKNSPKGTGAPEGEKKRGRPKKKPESEKGPAKQRVLKPDDPLRAPAPPSVPAPPAVPLPAQLSMQVTGPMPPGPPPLGGLPHLPFGVPGAPGFFPPGAGPFGLGPPGGPDGAQPNFYPPHFGFAFGPPPFGFGPGGPFPPQSLLPPQPSLPQASQPAPPLPPPQPPLETSVLPPVPTPSPPKKAGKGPARADGAASPASEKKKKKGPRPLESIPAGPRPPFKPAYQPGCENVPIQSMFGLPLEGNGGEEQAPEIHAALGQSAALHVNVVPVRAPAPRPADDPGSLPASPAAKRPKEADGGGPAAKRGRAAKGADEEKESGDEDGSGSEAAPARGKGKAAGRGRGRGGKARGGKAAKAENAEEAAAEKIEDEAEADSGEEGSDDEADEEAAEGEEKPKRGAKAKRGRGAAPAASAAGRRGRSAAAATGARRSARTAKEEAPAKKGKEAAKPAARGKRGRGK